MKYSTFQRSFAIGAIAILTTIAASACVAPMTQSQSDTAASQQTSQSATASTKLNINTASKEEFLTIPDVGDKMVDEFMEYRPFANIEHFRKEIGKYVDAKQLAEYEKYIFVPVDINTASEAELLTIPGVGGNMVKEFMEYRPFTNIDHFRKEIGKYVDDTQLAEYEKYIVIGSN